MPSNIKDKHIALNAGIQLSKIMGFAITGEIFYVAASTDPVYTFWRNRVRLNNLKTTLAAAYSAVTTNRGDIIILSGNSAHEISAMLDWSKSRVHVIGADGGDRVTGQGGRITMGVTTDTADIAMLKVTGNRNTFTNIKFYSTNTLSEHLYGIIAAGESTIFRNCCFEMNNKSTTANMAEVLSQGTNDIFIRCSLGGDSYVISSNARPNLLFDASVGNSSVSDGTEFKECRFTRWSGLAANPNIKVAAAADVTNYCIFDNCIFSAKKAEGGSTITDALVQGASLTAGSMLFKDCACLNVTNIYTPGGKTGAFTNNPASASAGGKLTQVA